MPQRESDEVSTTVRAFVRAVYPEMPELCMASNSEKEMLSDATKRILGLEADCRTLEMRAADAEALVLSHEGHIARLEADLAEAQGVLRETHAKWIWSMEWEEEFKEAIAKAHEAGKEQAMNPHKEPLQRIADQADLLATKARVISALYDRLYDKGTRPPAPSDFKDATQDLQAAIVAVLRVSADYL